MDISSNAPSNGSGRAFSTSFGSWAAGSPLAAQSVAQDAEGEPDYESSDEQSDATTVRPTQLSMSGAYRRPSLVANAGRGAVLQGRVLGPEVKLSKQERELIREEERSLLRDNSLIPPKHPRTRKSDDNMGARIGKKFSVSGLRKIKSTPDEESGLPSILVDGNEAEDEDMPSETTPLVGRAPDMPYGGEASPTNIDKKWEEAVTNGMIQTSWQREAKVLGKYSRSLIVTFILQYSLTMASIFTVGHIGKAELGAVSLASSRVISFNNTKYY